MNIKKHLIKFNDSALPESFVSLAVKVDENHEPVHAAILIRYKNINHLHHYSFTAILQESFTTDKWYVYKILDIIKVDDHREVGAFLQYCKRISGKSDMTYGFVSDGSAYSESGDFESRVGLPEIGTCVSYCLNTLTKLFYDMGSYLHLEDWDASTVSEEHPLYNLAKQQTFSRFPELVHSGVYNAFRKRVTPLEYLCSSFFNEYPIKKEQIDSIKESVEKRIVKMLPKN